jgi:hypothetical protein
MRPTRTTTAPRRGQGRTSMAPRRPLGARRTSTHVVRHCPTAGTTTACRSCRRRIPAPPSSPDVDPVVGGPNPAQGHWIFHSTLSPSPELSAAPCHSFATELGQNFEEGPAAAVLGARAGSRLSPPAAAEREGGGGRRWCGELGRRPSRPRRGRPERFGVVFYTSICFRTELIKTCNTEH